MYNELRDKEKAKYEEQEFINGNLNDYERKI